jgi:hypothetical protein
MREYEISITQRIVHRLYVIAENEESALEMFWDALASGDTETDEYGDFYPDDPIIEETGYSYKLVAGYTD